MKKAAASSIMVAVMLLAVSVMAEAQQPKKVFRIGYLSSGNPTSDSARVEGIRLALRELGYIEGQNIAMEYRYAEGRSDRESGLAAELVRLKVNIIAREMRGHKGDEGSGLLILKFALQLSQRLRHRASGIVCHPLNGVADCTEMKLHPLPDLS